MPHIRFDRLLELSIFLEGVPNESYWQGSFVGGQSIEGKKPIVDGVHLCGTSACAMGWAGHMPQFQKEGLRFTDGYFRLNGEMMSGFDAAEKFFNIGATAAATLFGGGHFTPHGKACQIRKWMLERGYEPTDEDLARINDARTRKHDIRFANFPETKSWFERFRR